jgi:hypothetical protein
MVNANVSGAKAERLAKRGNIDGAIHTREKYCAEVNSALAEADCTMLGIQRTLLANSLRERVCNFFELDKSKSVIDFRILPRRDPLHHTADERSSTIDHTHACTVATRHPQLWVCEKLEADVGAVGATRLAWIN